MDYQILVLGGGPGGYTAAIRASQYGLKTAIIEKTRLGGTCLNRGCIPTKAMLATAELASKINESEDFGINVSSFKIDINKVIEKKDRVVDELVAGLDKIFKTRKIEVFNNFGKIISKNEIELDNGTILSAEKIILATGSEPLNIPFFNIDGKNVITSNEALNLKEIPKNILIIGGGVVGCEFASMLHDFGSEVTIVEMLKSLIPTEDNRISRTLQTAFKKKDIKLKLKTSVEKIDILKDGKIKVDFSDGTTEVYAQVLAAAGRSMNLKQNGIDTLGFKFTDKKFIEIDDKMKTNFDNIYAIGDITGKMQLAHVAAAQGLAAVADIAGKTAAVDYTSIPSAIFTTPEIASIGAREQDLKAAKEKYRTSIFPFAANGKAKALGEEIGFVKIITDNDGLKLLGAHIIGPHASDILPELALIKENNLPLNDLIKTVHSHPTLSEAVLEAVENIHKMAIHML